MICGGDEADYTRKQSQVKTHSRQSPGLPGSVCYCGGLASSSLLPDGQAWGYRRRRRAYRRPQKAAVTAAGRALMGTLTGMGAGEVSSAAKPLNVTAVGSCTISVRGTITRSVPLPGPGFGIVAVDAQVAGVRPIRQAGRVERHLAPGWSRRQASCRWSGLTLAQGMSAGASQATHCQSSQAQVVVVDHRGAVSVQVYCADIEGCRRQMIHCVQLPVKSTLVVVVEGLGVGVQVDFDPQSPPTGP